MRDVEGNSWLKAIWGNVAMPLLVVLGFLWVVFGYLGNPKVVISSDGEGYYDYLPSIFLRKDIARPGWDRDSLPDLHGRVATMEAYLDYGRGRVNKYPAGVALLQAPFFFAALSFAELKGDQNDGYQLGFNKAIFWGAAFYLFLGLIGFQQLLRLYGFSNWLIAFLLLLLALATSVTHYANAEAAFSHVYSLFAFAWFAYFAKSFFQNPNRGKWLGMAAFFGLILLIRNVNVLVLLFLPFLAGSWGAFIRGILPMLKDIWAILGGMLAVAAFILLQSWLWHLQTGEWFLYSYGREGFDFSNPEILNVLFSFRKGLFIYSPIFFLSLFGWIWLLWQRRWFLAWTWMAAFLILSFVISSWWSWFYGCSYGMRPYLEYAPFFLVLLGTLLKEAKSKAKWLLAGLALLTIPLNIIQTYQYDHYIIEWMKMDRHRYWRIFLKTDKRYEGLFFREERDTEGMSVVKEVALESISLKAGEERELVSFENQEIPQDFQLKFARIQLENDFAESAETRVLLHIERISNSEVLMHQEIPVLHFQVQGFDKWHRGFYDMRIKPMAGLETFRLSLQIVKANQDFEAKNILVQFWGAPL